MRAQLILLGAAFLIACSKDKGATDDSAAPDSPADDSGSDDTGTPQEFAIDVINSRDGVELVLTGGVGGYLFGLAVTDPNSFDPWTGEDCYEGYTDSSGVLYSICHPASATGVVLTGVDDYTEVVAGSTTLMHKVSDRVTTYFLLSADTMGCWVWGHDTPYYAGLGCEEYAP